MADAVGGTNEGITVPLQPAIKVPENSLICHNGAFSSPHAVERSIAGFREHSKDRLWCLVCEGVREGFLHSLPPKYLNKRTCIFEIG